MHDKQCDRLHPASSWEAFLAQIAAKKRSTRFDPMQMFFKMLLELFYGF